MTTPTPRRKIPRGDARRLLVAIGVLQADIRMAKQKLSERADPADIWVLLVNAEKHCADAMAGYAPLGAIPPRGNR